MQNYLLRLVNGLVLTAVVSVCALSGSTAEFEHETVRKGLWKTFEYENPDMTPVVFSGWSRSTNAEAEYYCVSLDIYYDDGKIIWGKEAPFRQGTHDWEKATAVFIPEKPIKTIKMNALFQTTKNTGRQTRGTAEFRDFSLERREGNGEILPVCQLDGRPFSSTIDTVTDCFEGNKLIRRIETSTSDMPSRSPLADGEVVVWTADSMRLVTPLTFPTPTDPKSISLELACRERESAQVLISMPNDVEWENVMLELPTLRDSEGHALSGSVVWQRQGYLAREPGALHHPYAFPADEKWFPDVLLPAAPMRVRRGGTQGAWITVHANADATPGVYCGEVAVLEKGAERARVPVAVTVWDFSLPETFGLETAYALMDCFLHDLYPDSLEQKRREAWDIMLDHRLNPTDISRTTLPAIDDLLYARQRGMNRFCILNVVPLNNPNSMVLTADASKIFTDSFYSEFTGVVKPYVEELKKFGLDKLAYIYGFDEQPESYYSGIEEFYRKFSRDVPGIPLMTTAKIYRDYARGQKDPSLQKDLPVLSACDWYCPVISDYDLGVSEELRAKGKKVWWYICCSPHYPYANFSSWEYPPIEGRLLGWMTHRWRADGFLFWIVNKWYANYHFSEDDTYFPDYSTYNRNGMPGDGIMLYPGSEHILDSIRLAQCRDAEEDYEYLKILAEKTENSAADRETDTIIRALGDYTRDPVEVRAARRRVALALSSGSPNVYTLKSSVSGIDFDWADGSNYVGEPENGPAKGDMIVIPSGVTAIVNESAAASNGTCGKCHIYIEEGGVFQVYTPPAARTKTYVQSITGRGTVLQPDTQKNEKGAALAFDLDIQDSCVFDGKLVGTLNYRIYKEFTLTDADQGGLKGSPLISANARFRLARLTKNGNSILGSGSFNMNSKSVVEYLGGPDISRESYGPPVWSGTDCIFDAGAYGGFTYNGYFGSSATQWNLTLTGSNVTEAVFAGKKDINSKTGLFGPLAFAKEGSGIWHMKKNLNSYYGSVFEVRDGTLRYDDLAPMGENCSLGLANSLYKFGTTDLTDANKVDYSILLGGDGTEGFLQCVGTGETIVSNYDRLVVLRSAGGLRNGNGRVNFSGITAASAGAKTLILDGEVDGYDAVEAVSNGLGVVSIEKRGAGTWTLRPPFGITGRIAVKGGRLNLGTGPAKPYYDWYRLRLKTNAFQDPLFADKAKEYYETLGKAALPDNTKRRIAVAEFMFFDANGNRQCVYPMRHCKNGVDYFNGKLVTNSNTIDYQSTNRWALLCQPGEFSAENPTADWASFESSARAFCALFEGGKDESDAAYAAGTFRYNDWFDLTLKHNLDINDESTWVGVILRPTNNTPPLVACDFVNQDGDASQWVGRNMTAFDVSASTDGINWDPLLDVRLEAMGHNSSKSGAGPTTRKLAADKLANCYQFSRTAPSQPTGPALDLAATVSVETGATLFCSSPVAISKLSIGADGMGAISGSASIAAAGTVEVEPLPTGQVSKTYTTGLKDVAGAANLANWTLVVGGRTGAYDYAYDAVTGAITVSRKPFALTFR